MQPRLLARSEHNISRKQISKNALKVLYRLQESGHGGYLVGGGVRDLLLSASPKDFDIATDASPEEVQALFRNCRLIGRRFRLAHVVFGREIIEVATFRASHAQGQGGVTDESSGLIVRDNVYGGTLAEDAERRDFTVNALYYNIEDFSVIDFFDGVEHINQKVLTFIGDASDRVVEDPVRALRAVRFAAKLNFDMDADCIAAIEQHRHNLEDIPAARLFEEVLKLFQSGCGLTSFELLREHDLFRYLFPVTDEVLNTGNKYAEEMVRRALANTDTRISQELPVTPAFIYAVMLWPSVSVRAKELEDEGEDKVPALHRAADEILPQQLASTSLPRRFSVPMREIWVMQPRLKKSTRGGRAKKIMSDLRFRAAYDFMCLRCESGESDLQDLCDEWEAIQQTPEAQKILEEVRNSRKPRARKKRRRRNNERQKQ